MTFRFTVSAVLAASPKEVYDAWLDGRKHGAMTGARARGSKKVGGTFAAWDDYISGRNLILEPGKRIVQAWRTTQFSDKDPDSQIELLLTRVAGGTKLTLRHTKVPDGHESYRDGGWRENYFAPMKAYFAKKK
ncbi:MAG TPA: SRPBCC domain-containing protein [Stellaceae bacterium]|jgi:activator of HSP90 ATPase|nr:SRPBCC domain-containing protein [Stellaceae bacterium]